MFVNIDTVIITNIIYKSITFNTKYYKVRFNTLYNKYDCAFTASYTTVQTH